MQRAFVRILLVATLAAPAALPAQDVTFTGRVASADGRPLAGARVTVEGTNRRAVTAADGTYRLRATGAAASALRGGDARLRAAMLGFETATRTVAVPAEGGEVRADFVLRPAAVELDALVATDEAAARRSAIRIRGASPMAPVAGRPLHPHRPDWNREGYRPIDENPFRAVAAEPLSTFAVDVDRASYSNVRRFVVREGRLPPPDAVRVEELVNYFPYAYAAPRGDAPVSITTETMAAPWRPQHRLVRIGLQAPRIRTADLPPNNLVFLLDVSGSMRSPDKLPLLQRSMALLAETLRPQDRVAIVVYAGAAGVVLPSTPGSDRGAILEAVDRLEAGGSTAGAAGIRLAYRVARDNFAEGGNNRVILATDGDFNVGVSSDAELVRLIERERESGVFLTVLGFGTGNLQDAKMEQLADRGNGNYAYIDDLAEARKTLVEELGATLVTVAKDVKVQVEFNPARVAAYRLVGYENRLLANEDFADDTKDGGEVGAGHSVTALYEVIPVGVESPVEVRMPDSLRYQTPRAPSSSGRDGELAYVRVRYKEPDGETSREISVPVRDGRGGASDDLRFAASVAAYGMLLRDSPHRGEMSVDGVLELADGARGDDPGGHRAAFVELVRASGRLLAEREDVAAGRR